MSDRPWKQEEREVARLLGGSRYPANSGGRVDVEAATLVAQVKHVRILSLAQLEALALEMQAVGSERGKVGLVVVKRQGGRGHDTPRLIVMTEEAWCQLHARTGVEHFARDDPSAPGVEERGGRRDDHHREEEAE